jgi:PEP-CTERM motif-containing protein
MRFRRMMFSVVAFWLVAMLLPTSASAQFRLRVEDLTTGLSQYGYGVVVTDNGVADEDAQDGRIQVSFFTFEGTPIENPLSENVHWSLTVGISKPDSFIGPSTLELQSFNLTSTGAATVRLTLEDIGFSLGAPGSLNLVNGIGGSFCAGGTPDPLTSCQTDSAAIVVVNSFANAGEYVPVLGVDSGLVNGPLGPMAASGALTEIGANTADAIASQTFNLGYSGSGPTAFAGTTSSAFDATNPLYSMFTQIVISFAGAGDINFTQDTTTVVAGALETPEPGSLMLIGTGVVALAGRRRRRKLTRV